MRITPDLIQSCSQSINAIKQRQLNLQGLKIPIIENLGTTLDFYDYIDLSNNEITVLASFSTLNNLRTLNLTNNHVGKIENIAESFPNLENLVLIGNRLTDLSEIDNLSSSRNLTRVYLMENKITQDPNYRFYVIHKLPHLKVLDFQRVRQEEREHAEVLFGKLNLQSPKEIFAKMDKNAKIKLAIEKAKTVEEISRLEILLKCGELSEALLDQKLIEYKIF